MIVKIGVCIAVCCAIALIAVMSPYGSASQAASPFRPPGDPLTEGDRGDDGVKSANGSRIHVRPILWGVGVVVLLLVIFANVLGRAVAQPARISVASFQEVAGNPEDGSQYFRDATNKLVWAGFTPMLDFTIPELPHPGVYRWFLDESGANSALLLEVTPSGSGLTGESVKLRFVEFQTTLDNGGKINTNNNPLRDPLLMPPTYLVVSHKKIEEPKELFELHLQNVERFRTETGGDVQPQKYEEFANNLTREWIDIMEYQAQAGLMKLSKDGRSYRGTAKLIINYFLPGLIRRPPIKSKNEPINPHGV